MIPIRLENFVYEFKNSIRKKSTIAFVIIILLTSSIIGYTFKFTDNQFHSGYIGTLALGNYYKDNGSYNVVIDVFDQYGNPVENTQVNISVDGGNFTGFQLISFTNSNGIADFTLGNLENLTPVKDSNFSFVEIYGTYKVPYKWVSVTDQRWSPIVPTPVIVNGTYPYNHRYSAILLQDPNNRFMDWLHLFYVGPEGQLAPTTKVYYEAYSPNYTKPYSTLIDQNKMNYSETVSNFEALNIPTGVSFNSTHSNYVIALFSQNGSVLSSVSGQVIQKLTPREINVLLFEDTLKPMEILLPIMGILFGYSLYGRERELGVIENVGTKPITRGTLTLSRFSSAAIAILLTTLASLGIIWLSIRIYNLVFPPEGLFFLLSFSLFVSALPIAAIVMVLSHLIKSSSRLISASIFVFFFFYFLINVIFNVIITTIPNLSYVSPKYATMWIASQYFSPIGLGNLAQLAVLGGSGFVSGSPQTLASYGLTTVNIVFAGLAWVLVPLAILIVLSTKRE